MEQPVPQRKQIRLRNYSYNAPGYYFITVCTREKRKLLCSISTDEEPSAPTVTYSDAGKLALSQLRVMSDFYDTVKLDRYVVMPNHVHFILIIPDGAGNDNTDRQNSVISKFVGSFKRFTDKAAKNELWQARYYDHVIRNEKEYLEICEYIDNNPAKWSEDGLYIPDLPVM